MAQMRKKEFGVICLLRNSLGRGRRCRSDEKVGSRKDLKENKQTKKQTVNKVGNEV